MHQLVNLTGAIWHLQLDWEVDDLPTELSLPLVPYFNIFINVLFSILECFKMTLYNNVDANTVYYCSGYVYELVC